MIRLALGIIAFCGVLVTFMTMTARAAPLERHQLALRAGEIRSFQSRQSFDRVSVRVVVDGREVVGLGLGRYEAFVTNGFMLEAIARQGHSPLLIRVANLRSRVLRVVFELRQAP